MTQDKALKAAIRARMADTGEPYSVARHAVLGESPDSGERGGARPVSDPEAAEVPAEDYYARYAREAELAGVPAVEAQAAIASEQAQELADRAQEAADRAQEMADEAEEAAERAEERADLAEEAAGLAQEWADADEQVLAQQRADRMRELAAGAREQADQAQERAERAQERAEHAQELADQIVEDEDEFGGEHGPAVWHYGPPPPAPPAPPSPPPFSGRRAWDGQGRLLSRLDELQHRFDQVRERANTFLDRLGLDQERTEGQD